MNICRIFVPLDEVEARVLLRMAEEQCRPPREQLRFLLREEARKRGLLAPDQEERTPKHLDNRM